jgi:hypothetical protein
MRWLFALVCFVTFIPLYSQPSWMQLGGYVKSLTSRTSTPDDSVFYDHLLHARLNSQWFPQATINGTMDFRFRWYYGPSVERVPDFSRQLGYDAGFGKLGVVLWDEPKSVAYGEIDRLFLNWVPGPWQVTVGRQRVAWGTNLVWNVIDLFNPLSILDFDYEELPPSDAVRVQYYTGAVSKVELAIRPGSRAVKSISAAQWTTNRWNYDFHFLGGVRGTAWFGGTGWAGDIAGAGFRGEALVAGIPPELQLPEGNTRMLSAALSGDYTFPNSFYIHTEAMYNSEGVTADAALARPRAVALGLLSPARWSLFQEFSYNVSPLVRAGAFAIYNPNDHSAVIFPSVTWSVITNLDLSFLALFFSGAPLTEYGGLGTLAYLRLKWSF